MRRVGLLAAALTSVTVLAGCGGRLSRSSWNVAAPVV